MLHSGSMKWSSLNFRLQLLLVLILLTAVVTAIFTFFLISYERNTYQRQLRFEGQIFASFLTRELQLPLYADNREEVARLTTAMFVYRGINAIRVKNGKGEVVADCRRSPDNWERDHLAVSDSVITANSTFSPEAQLLGEMPAPGEVIGAVELALDTLFISAQLQHFIRAAILIALSFWITASIAGFLVLQRMTKTLSLLLAGIDKLAAGNLESRIIVKNDSDTGQAAAAINQLAETLQQREEENRRLQLEMVNSLRLELDEEKTRHMAKLIQTNRMTSLGLLVSSMAHEINNPNGTIRLAGEYLEKTWRDGEKLLDEIASSEGDFSLGGLPLSQAKEEVHKALDSIARSSTRIERVVQNLRSYSLGDRYELRRDVDLNRVASGALAIVQAHSRKADVNIATRLDPQLPLVHGNPFQLEQVLTNLLLNAIQALPPTGSRRITLTTAWQPHDGSISVEVRDEGRGIPAEHLPHLCEPFFSTRIEVGGSGLGLYIANFIINEHQGSLTFASQEGNGTTVTIHLPVNPTADNATAVTSLPPVQPAPASC